MTTRRKFTGAMLAASTLANFTLIAGTPGNGNGNPCNGHGKADQCHGRGAKADNVPPTPGCRSNARMSQDNTPPPVCRSAGGKEDHVE